MATPTARTGATLKLLVIAVLSTAMWATPTAAAQGVSPPTPDPAPDPAPAPVQPAPDPVPQPQPASTAPGGTEESPPVSQPPAEPAPVQPPAAAAPEPAVPAAPTPAAERSSATTPAPSDTPSHDGRGKARGARDGGKAQPNERERSTPADTVNPHRVLSGVGPLVVGLRDRAADAAPPIALAALALLTLALTSGGFLVVATRRTGTWRG